MARRSLALEFRANQLEQLTGHRVTGGTISPHGVCFRLAANMAPDLARLRQIFGRGVRVRVEQPGRLAVEARASQAHRVPLGQLVAGRLLPALVPVLGVDEAGRPVLLALDHCRHLLVVEPGRSARSLLLAAALSLVMAGRQRDLQLVPLGDRLQQASHRWPHRLDLSLRQIYNLARWPRPGRPALIVVHCQINYDKLG